MASFTTEFNIGDVVYIDSDTSIAASIVSFQFKDEGHIAELSWAHNGCLQTGWLNERRLRLAPFVGSSRSI